VVPPCARTKIKPIRFLALIALVAVACGFGGFVIVVRVHDASTPTVKQADLESQTMGTYSDGVSAAGLQLIPDPSYTAAGLTPPEQRWTLDADPGRPSRGDISLVLLDNPGVWTLNVQRPVLVVIRLPSGAQLKDEQRKLRVPARTPGACASWFDGKTVGYVKGQVERSVSGPIAVTCQLPKIGHVVDLFFEVAFAWDDPTLHNAGYSRQSGAFRFETLLTLPTDIPVPGSVVLRPSDLQLSLPPGESLVDSFPGPDGGGIGTRRWMVNRSQEIEYIIENKAHRVWIQPTTETAVLLTGVLLGLLPAAWPRRTAENHAKPQRP
jgi:hypothetical protein